VQISKEHTQISPTEDYKNVFGLVLSYIIVLILLFFALGGTLPNAGSTTSALQVTANASNTLTGILFQGVTWMVALLIMAPTLGSILQDCLEVKALTLLTALAPLSALWSLQPSDSLRRGVFLFFGTLFAIYLVRTFKPVELAQMLMLTGVAVGLLGIAVSIADPVIGRDIRNGGAWQGVFGSKNGCAQYMLYLLSPAICFRFSRRSVRLLSYALYLVAAILIVMSRAKTAWVLLPALILFTAWFSQLRRISTKSARFLAFATGGMAVVAAFGIPLAATQILQLLGKESTLSGRVPLWTGVLTAIFKRPLLGYGYDAFWHQGLQGEVLNIFAVTHFEIFQAQNGFLEVWLELGVVGLALMLWTLVQAAQDATACLRDGDLSSTRWYIGLLVITVIYNVDETFFTLANSLPWLLFMVACVGLAQEARRVRSLPSKSGSLHLNAA
jgi:exopolysaccharide production protein ExoQ